MAGRARREPPRGHGHGHHLLAAPSPPRDPTVGRPAGTPERLATALRWQGEWCARLGSPLYAALLARAADDALAGGPVWTLLEEHAGDRSGSALALRFLGAVHRLVLEGRAPALARHYPSAGGTAGPHGAWETFRDVVVEQRTAIYAHVRDPVQTNEVGRAAALLGGFLLVVRETGLPLRVLELGASAGLNLRWDHYRYEADGQAFGNPESPVRLADAFLGAPPFLVHDVRVVERAGCDAAPLDPCSAEGRLTLLSYLWPDQEHRRALLLAALEVARRVPARVDAADVIAWATRMLATPPAGVATVVFHSIVMPYLGQQGREALGRALEDAGSRATHSSPLACLRMEAGGEQAEIRLVSWPGGEERLLATTGFHGPPVRWLLG